MNAFKKNVYSKLTIYVLRDINIIETTRLNPCYVAQTIYILLCTLYVGIN